MRLASLADAHAADSHGRADHGSAEHGHDDHAEHAWHKPVAYTGTWYTLGEFGDLKITISYYIQALTVCMFTMVTLIASCIHFYAIGYMHDELHDITDREVLVTKGYRGHGHAGHGHGADDVHAHAHDDVEADHHGHGHERRPRSAGRL